MASLTPEQQAILERGRQRLAAQPQLNDAQRAILEQGRSRIQGSTASQPGPAFEQTGRGPQPVEEPGTLDSLLRGLHVGGQGLAEIPANVLGFPGDIVEMASSALSNPYQGLMRSIFGDEVINASTEAFAPVQSALDQTENPLLPTSEGLKRSAGDALRSVGLGDMILQPEDMSRPERIAKAVTELGGEALLGGTGLARAAERGSEFAGQFAPEIARALPTGQTGKVLAGDVAAAGSAGGAMQAGEEFGATQAAGELFGPAGETLTRLLLGAGGGIGGALGARGVINVGETAGQKAGVLPSPPPPRVAPVDPVTGEPFSQAVQEAAAVRTQRAASNPANAASNIGDARRALEEGPTVLPGEMPTVGMLAGDVGLAGMESGLRGSGDPLISREFVERDVRRAQRARDILEETAPPGDGRGFTDEFERRAGTRREEARTAREQAQTAEERFAAERQAEGEALAAEAPRKADAARRIDETVVAELTEAQRAKNERFNNPALREEVRDLDFLQEAAAAERKSVTKGARRADETPTEFIARIRKLRERDPETGKVVGAGQMTVADLQARRTELARIESQARREQNFVLADSARRLKQAINEDFQQLADEGNPEAAEALRFFQEDFAPRFAAGPQDEAQRFRSDFNQDRAARTTTPPSKTAGRFLQPASPEKAASLRRIVDAAPNREEAAAATRQFLLADLAQSGVIDSKGNVSRVKLGKWRQRWGDETLNTAAPGFADEIDALSTKAGRNEERAAALRDEVKAATDNEKLTEAQITKGALGFALGRSPENAVGAVFKSGDPRRNMVKIVAEIGDDAAARDGLKQAVREYLLDTATNVENGLITGRPVSRAKISDLFEKNAAALSEVFSPDEMNSLRQVHRLIKNEPAPRNIKALDGSSTSEREARQRFLGTTEVGLKAYFGMLRGGGMTRALKLGLDVLEGSLDQKVRRLEAQLMLDPELAQHFLRVDTNTSPAAWTTKLQRLLQSWEAVSQTAEDDSEN